MGHPPSGHRKYQISHTWEIHNEIIRLTAVGMRQVDIAAQLGVTAAMVSYTLNSDIARARLAELRGMRDAEAVDVISNRDPANPGRELQVGSSLGLSKYKKSG